MSKNRSPSEEEKNLDALFKSAADLIKRAKALRLKDEKMMAQMEQETQPINDLFLELPPAPQPKKVLSFYLDPYDGRPPTVH